jgi:hypothetical protein
MYYLPLTPSFFAILVGFFFIMLILRSVRYAYESLGVSSNTAILVIHWMAYPVLGLGITVPVFIVTAIVAVLLSREDSAPLPISPTA